MAKPKVASSLMFKRNMCHSLVIHLQEGSFTLKFEMRVVGMVGNHLVRDMAVQQILRKKGGFGCGIPDVL